MIMMTTTIKTMIAIVIFSDNDNDNGRDNSNDNDNDNNNVYEFLKEIKPPKNRKKN